MSWTNLLRPWFLAESAASLSSAALCAYGAWIAVRVLRRFRVAETSEGQLALERRAELAAAAVGLALVLQILSLALLIFAADRAAGSLRGAMCAYGVFFSSPWGPRALAMSGIAAITCGLWSVEHRLDLLARTPTWMRRKFEALLFVALLVFGSAFTSIAFFLDLDFDAAASCCSTALDGGRVTRFASAPFFPPALGTAAVICGLGALLNASFYARRPARRIGWFASTASILAGVVGAAAVPWIVAPYVYETPVHTCPFCLLHGPSAVIGWPLISALAAGFFSGLALAWTLRSPIAQEEPVAFERFAKNLARTAAFAWGVALIFGIAPVVRYTWITGGASLFGAIP